MLAAVRLEADDTENLRVEIHEFLALSGVVDTVGRVYECVVGFSGIGSSAIDGARE